MNSKPASSAVRVTVARSAPSRAGPAGVVKSGICRPIFTRHLHRRGVGSDVGTAGNVTHEGGVKQPREQIAVTAGKNLIVVAAYQRLVLRQLHADMLACRS
jgi:hypothetical protein